VFFCSFCWCQNGGSLFGFWAPFSDYSFYILFIFLSDSGCIEDTFIFNSVNNTCIFYQCILWVFLQNHRMFWNKIITARNAPI
jgi:hypothetical protein